MTRECSIRPIFIEKTGKDCWIHCNGGKCVFTAYEVVAILKAEPERAVK
jgi:hypothetical protein